MESRLDSFILANLSGSVVSVTGSGGKTSLILLLSRAASAAGRSVLITTTTKLSSPAVFDYGSDRLFADGTQPPLPPRRGSIDFYALPFSQTKVCAPDVRIIEQLAPSYDLVLIEADGARGLPLKLHRAFEPVVPAFTTDTIAVAGIRDFGKRATEESFFNLPQDWRGRVIDKELIARLVSHPMGLLKNSSGRTMILLNQSDAADFGKDRPESLFPGMVCGSVRENRIEK